MAPVYTRRGDGGQTVLAAGRRVPKTDSRIELIGTLEELSGHLGEVRAFTPETESGLRETLQTVQDHLAFILRYLRGQAGRGDSLGEDTVGWLEQKIDAYDPYFSEFDPYARAESCRTAAMCEVARTVARRAERIYVRADISLGSRETALHRRYLNRLGDYLWAAARYLDAKRREETGRQAAEKAANAGPQPESRGADRWNATDPICLANVKIFLELLEKEAARRDLKLVFAVANSAGRPVAVHVMDDAYIASYDVAVNKAFTAVSLKMPTKELAKLCAPGGSLYGLQETNQGRIVILGGGVPLKNREDKIVGGLGVSGSSAEIDTMMGDVAAELFLRLQTR